VNNWRKFRLLSQLERLLLIQSLLLLPLNGLALRLASFKRWQSILARLSPIKNDSIEILSEAQIEIARAAFRMARAASGHGLYRAKCLPESLTLWWLLRRRGIESRLRFGARKQGALLEAHAWVEIKGIPLNDSADVERRFMPFKRSAMSAEGKP
jgi:transglutaminase superfamily protein